MRPASASASAGAHRWTRESSCPVAGWRWPRAPRGSPRVAAVLGVAGASCCPHAARRGRGRPGRRPRWPAGCWPRSRCWAATGCRAGASRPARSWPPSSPAAAIHYWGEGSFYGPLPFLFPVALRRLVPARGATLAVMALTGGAAGRRAGATRTAATPRVGAWVATVGHAGRRRPAGRAAARAHQPRRSPSLTEAARRDPLTGLLNRRGFEEVFDVELERARRTEQSLSVIVGDLDRFKRVNDQLRPRRRRRRAAPGGAGAGRAASAAGTPPRGSAARSSRSWPRTPTSTARTSWPSACAPRSRASSPASRGPADHQLRDRQLPGARPDRLVAAPGRRPGPVRRQAAGPQPLGDLQRRGAGHPRRARSRDGREDASVELSSLLVAGRGPGRARLAAAPPTAAAWAATPS